MKRQDEDLPWWDYFSGELDAVTHKELETSLREDPAQSELFKQTARKVHAIRWTALWDSLDEEKAYERLRRRFRRHRIRMRLISSAAVLALLVAGGLSFWLHTRPQTVTLATVDSDRLDTLKGPILTLKDGQQVSLRDSSQWTLPISGNVNIHLTDSGCLEYIPLTDTVHDLLHYNTLSIPRGCEFAVILSDGSRVWLNAESSLRFPERFVGKERKVFLEGEAYFEVAHNEQCPFRVITRDGQVTVLGTTFNVKAYPEEKESVTTLFSGSVEQYLSSVEQPVLLEPGQQIRFDRSDKKWQVVSADVEEVLAWKNGKLIARDKSLEEIFRLLARWYDFEVVYTRPALKEIKFHLHTNRYADIRTILEHLQSTNGIRFTYVDHKIYVSQ